VREEVFRLAVERRWAVRELTQRRGTLEDVFVELTHPDLV
jgi:ABC-2 type transport system ATP-binding protein